MLSKELFAGELTRGSVKTVGMPLQLQARLKKYRPPNREESESEEAENTPGPMAKKRCSTCTRDSGRRRLSRYECKKCHTALCLEHANLVCKSCFENKLKEQNKQNFVKSFVKTMYFLKNCTFQRTCSMPDA